MERNSLVDKEQTHITLANTRDVEYGRAATMSLFKQYNKKGKQDIHEWRKRFVATLDPTEYEGAISLVGSWADWLRFKKAWPSFKKLHLDAWLDEIEIQLRSQAIRSLAKAALTEKGTSAARFIAEGGYKQKTAGRPSTGEIQGNLRRESEIEKEIAEDVARVKDLFKA